MLKKLTKAGVITGVAGALVLSMALTGTASADPGYHYPNSVYYTGPGAVAGVGSDTIQDVENGLAKQIDATAPAANQFESWDAVDPTNRSTHGKIATKGTSFITNGFERPNGSGEGQSALSRSIDGGTWPVGDGTTTTLTGKIDYSRSSSGTGHYTKTEALTFIPFARDAVSFAYLDSTGKLAVLTTAQLTGIYNGSITSVSGTTVIPFLPQAGSGTRKFFLAAIGVPDDANLAALIGTNLVQENTSNTLVQGDIVPFSASQWIAQFNGQTKNFEGSAKLGSINYDGKPHSPYTGTTTLHPNSVFYGNTTFGRDVFNVVPTSTVTNTASPQYALFVTNSTNTALFGTSSAKTLIGSYGFLTVSYAGDATNAKGHTQTSPLVANQASVG